MAYNPDKKNANEKASKASTAAAASNKQSLPSSQPLSKAAGKPAASRNAKSGPSKSPAPPRNKSNNKRRSPEPTPSDSPSSESEPSSAPDDVVFAEDQTTKLFLKMPLLERFNLHSDKQPCCYEPPCEVYRYQRDLSREDLAEASTASILMKASGSSADASPKRLEVPISHGKPKHAKGILCLESVPMHSLMDLGLMSAKQEADLSNILLSGMLLFMLPTCICLSHANTCRIICVISVACALHFLEVCKSTPRCPYVYWTLPPTVSST